MNKKIFHTLFAPKINLPPRPKLIPVRYNIFTGSGFSGFGASEEELDNSYTRGFEDSQGFYESFLNKKIHDDPTISGLSLVNSTVNSPIRIPSKNIYDPYLDNSISQVPSNVTSTMSSRQLTRTNSFEDLASEFETNVKPDKKMIEEKFRRDPKIINKVREQVDSLNLPAKDIPKAIKNKMDQLTKVEAEKFLQRFERHDQIQSEKKLLQFDAPSRPITRRSTKKSTQESKEPDLYSDDSNLIEKPDPKQVDDRDIHSDPNYRLDEDDDLIVKGKKNKLGKEKLEMHSWMKKLASKDSYIPTRYFENFYNLVKNQPEELTKESWDSYKDLNGFFAVPNANGEYNNLKFANKVIDNINAANKNKGIHFEPIKMININETRPPLVKFLRENYIDLDILKKHIDENIPIVDNPDIKSSVKKYSSKTQKKPVKYFSSEIEVTDKPNKPKKSKN